MTMPSQEDTRAAVSQYLFGPQAQPPSKLFGLRDVVVMSVLEGHDEVVRKIGTVVGRSKPIQKNHRYDVRLDDGTMVMNVCGSDLELA